MKGVGIDQIEAIEARKGGPVAKQVAWRVSPGPVAYGEAVAWMEAQVAGIRAGTSPETVWFVQHPPLYTAGTSADKAEMLDPDRFPVYPTGRGGRYTYHGPGQRVMYVMLDLKPRGGDVRAFVRALEQWMIETLARFAVVGERRADRVGIWVHTGDGQGGGTEAKIGAIGVRVRRWVTYHGASLNVDPNLEHFAGIVPCGVSGHGVTSLAALGIGATMDQVDGVLRETFEQVFGVGTSDWKKELGDP